MCFLIPSLQDRPINYVKLENNNSFIVKIEILRIDLNFQE